MLLALSWQLYTSIYLISVFVYKRPNSLRTCYIPCTLIMRSWQAAPLVSFSIILRCGTWKRWFCHCGCWPGSFFITTRTKRTDLTSKLPQWQAHGHTHVTYPVSKAGSFFVREFSRSLVPQCPPSTTLTVTWASLPFAHLSEWKILNEQSSCCFFTLSCQDFLTWHSHLKTDYLVCQYFTYSRGYGLVYRLYWQALLLLAIFWPGL